MLLLFIDWTSNHQENYKSEFIYHLFSVFTRCSSNNYFPSHSEIEKEIATPFDTIVISLLPKYRMQLYRSDSL